MNAATAATTTNDLRMNEEQARHRRQDTGAFRHIGALSRPSSNSINCWRALWLKSSSGGILSRRPAMRQIWRF